jgi:hypothetical protein
MGTNMGMKSKLRRRRRKRKRGLKRVKLKLTIIRKRVPFKQRRTSLLCRTKMQIVMS